MCVCECGCESERVRARAAVVDPRRNVRVLEALHAVPRQGGAPNIRPTCPNKPPTTRTHPAAMTPHLHEQVAVIEVVRNGSILPAGHLVQRIIAPGDADRHRRLALLRFQHMHLAHIVRRCQLTRGIHRYSVAQSY